MDDFTVTLLHTNLIHNQRIHNQHLVVGLLGLAKRIKKEKQINSRFARDIEHYVHNIFDLRTDSGLIIPSDNLKEFTFYTRNKFSTGNLAISFCTLVDHLAFELKSALDFGQISKKRYNILLSYQKMLAGLLDAICLQYLAISSSDEPLKPTIDDHFQEIMRAS